MAFQAALTNIPALGPENGGQGELEKALLIEQWLAPLCAYERVDSPDSRVESGIRPNIIARLPGKTSKTLWLFAHLDIVPPGEMAAWHSSPWQAVQKGGFIYGRGVEDNQQAIASMLVLAQALQKLKITPDLGLGLVFMADEECGSAHGLKFLLKTRPEIFKPDDYYIVPDGGSPDGSLIEIAEKAQLWLKFTVDGRQCHASTPGKGRNAFVGASHLVVLLNTLNEAFASHNPLFEPPVSNFCPTRHDANVDAVNIIPGKDVFYMDCRLLPELEPGVVIGQCRKMALAAAHRQGVAIHVDIEQENPATVTSKDSPVVKALAASIERVYQLAPKVCGIGGATVASYLRQAGLPAAVWATLENTCHQPNERSSIAATLKDAAVFGDMLFNADAA